MMPNFLPDISLEDKRILENFAKGDSAESNALKRVLKTHLDHFRDIRNVDPREDNVGLQACSHLRAYDMLEEIFGQIAFVERSTGEKKSNSFR